MRQARDHWGSRAGFVLAAAGSAIGLGNLWKFPFITWDNRGGAFVLVYLLCITVVGLPIMITEIMLGRKTQKSAVGAMKEAVGPAWGLVGGLGVLTGFVILSYYAVIAGWSLRNFVQCVSWSLGGFPSDVNVGAEFGAFLGDWKSQMLVALAFMAGTVAIVLRGVHRGIENVSRVLMPVLFGILILLLFSALTMSGSREALGFIFAPRFDQLGWMGVLEALGHSFFTLSLGMGAMITYGSYMKRHDSVVPASLAIVVLDTLIALMATVIMFSVIFSLDGMAEQVNKSPVAMLFITLPQLFYTTVPFGSILAPLFYVLVAFAALTSTISLLEVVVAYFIDEHGMSRSKSTGMCGAIITAMALACSVSLGAFGPLSNFVVFTAAGGPKQGLLSNLDHLASNWMLPLGGFFITLAAGWFMTREATQAELTENAPRWFHYGLWRFAIRYVAPLAVAAIILLVMFGKDFS